MYLNSKSISWFGEEGYVPSCDAYLNNAIGFAIQHVSASYVNITRSGFALSGTKSTRADLNHTLQLQLKYFESSKVEMMTVFVLMVGEDLSRDTSTLASLGISF